MDRRKSRNVLIFILIIIFAFLFVSFGKGYIWWKQIYSADNEDYLTPGNHTANPDADNEPDKKKPTVVMLLGLDQRANEPARADTIIILSLNWELNQLNVVSIPRDTRVEIPGRSFEKLNHAHAYGGANLTKKTLEQYLGVKIDNYITTNFVGFENIVDILGGVEIDVEKRMRYYASDVTIELDPGVQRLDGDKALQYVRFRADTAGDLGRVERQQKFIKAVISEAYQFKTILKLPQLLDELAKNIRTNMELNEMRKFISLLKSTEINEVNTITLPGKPRKIDGVSYLVVDEKEKERIVREYIKWE